MLKSSSFFAVLLVSTLGLSASAQAGCKVETKTDDFSGEEQRIASHGDASIVQSGDVISLNYRLKTTGVVQNSIAPGGSMFFKLEDGNIVELVNATGSLPEFSTMTMWRYSVEISPEQVQQLAASKIASAKVTMLDGDRVFSSSYDNGAKYISKIAPCFATEL